MDVFQRHFFHVRSFPVSGVDVTILSTYRLTLFFRLLSSCNILSRDFRPNRMRDICHSDRAVLIHQHYHFQFTFNFKFPLQPHQKKNTQLGFSYLTQMKYCFMPPILTGRLYLLNLWVQGFTNHHRPVDNYFILRLYKTGKSLPDVAPVTLGNLRPSFFNLSDWQLNASSWQPIRYSINFSSQSPGILSCAKSIIDFI